MTETVPIRDLERQQTGSDVLPSVHVVDAVASTTDADPMTMAPLYEAIDPDALDQLIAGDFPGHVQFDYAGHEIQVQGDGSVLVDGTDQEVQ